MSGKIMPRKFATICLITCFAWVSTFGQLAITEIMSSAKNDSSGNQNPDYWELTNYGTNMVDLSGYSWNDNAPNNQDSASFNGLFIAPGESIIFAQYQNGNAATNATMFREWWGTNNVGTNVQIVFFQNNGLGSGGDSVVLWGPGAVNPSNYLDRVDFNAATLGRSFLYNTNTGDFTDLSTNGIASAWQAVIGGDEGSPGVAPSPSPAFIVQQPTDLTVVVGGAATFQVFGAGLPKPHFEWFYNDDPVDTNKVQISTFITNNFLVSTLIITKAQGTNAGAYHAVANNGIFAPVGSSNALLTVSGDPLAPVFTKTPVGVNAYIGQSPIFTASAFGNPPPGFQWQFNGTNLDGQTSSQLQISLSNTNQTGTYTVLITNSVGTNSASFFMLVTTKPNLRITEIMASEIGGGDHNDWWELSNLGDFSVNLKGYRFDDDSYSLAQAYTITNDVSIAPGESIVFGEKMTPKEFASWWGADRLPPNVQIIRYEGSSLSFSSTGDQLTLWNAAAHDENDSIDSVAFADATTGVSFGFDPYTQTLLGYAPEGLTIAGINGGVTAFVNGDVASPGTIVNVPGQVSVSPAAGGGVQLSWTSQPDYTYSVLFKTNLTDSAWQILTNLTATDNAWSITDPATNGQRFYRIQLNR